MKKTDFVIDYERLNDLTCTKQDDPEDGYTGKYLFSTSKTEIRNQIKLFTSLSNDINIETLGEKYVEAIFAINTLRYNKILLSKEDIRDTKLEKLLK
jgi:hypothetical protein